MNQQKFVLKIVKLLIWIIGGFVMFFFGMLYHFHNLGLNAGIFYFAGFFWVVNGILILKDLKKEIEK